MTSLSRLNKAINSIPGLRAAIKIHNNIITMPAVWLGGHVYKGTRYAMGIATYSASELAGMYAVADVDEHGALQAERMAGVLLDEAAQRNTFALLTSPGAAGALFRMLGKPASVEIRKWSEPIHDSKTIVTATYDKIEDTIVLHVSDQRRSPGCLAGTFWHEMGHVWQTRHGDAIGDLGDRHKIRPPDGKYANYALRSRADHQAEAIAAAIGILWILGRPEVSEKSLKAAIEQLEDKAPGSLLLARVLLGYPHMASGGIRERRVEGVDLSPVDLPGGWAHRDDSTAEEQRR